jgi:hypothetical protein
VHRRVWRDAANRCVQAAMHAAKTVELQYS